MSTQVKTKNGNGQVVQTISAVKVEPTLRWVRVQFNGEYIADSKNVLLVWETGRPINYYFPIEDVRMDLFEQGRKSTASDGKQYWDLRVGDRPADSIAWTFPDPVPGREALAGYLAFKWNKMDHWYEEEEEVFVHPRDPYSRVDTIPSSRHVRIEIDGITLADSTRPYLLFETGLPVRYYIPQEDVRMDLLEPAKGSSRCPYKGVASYWSVKLGDKIYRNYVWGYMDPIPEVPKIKGLLSFYNEKVDVYVDDESQ